MILRYKQKFVDKVTARIKIHTIRRDLDNVAVAGEELEMICDPDKGDPFEFYNDYCRHTQDIRILYSSMYQYPYVSIDGKSLMRSQIEDLVTNEGFDGVDQFFKFFDKNYDGKIIHWTDYEYLSS